MKRTRACTSSRAPRWRRVATAWELRQGAYDLVLVNRVLDEDSSSGLDLIRQLKADPALARIPVLLVSNYVDAQAQAVALGALRGFGKNDLGRPAARAAIAAAFQAGGGASPGDEAPG